MILDHRITVAAPVERAWELILDIPTMAACMPGVERISASGPATYDGILGVKVGPISARLEGRLRVVEQDAEHFRARIDVEATDRRIRGSVSGHASLQLEPRADGDTDLVVHTEASILGRLGQFGQPVLRRKADQIVGEWASNLAARLAQDGDSPAQRA